MSVLFASTFFSVLCLCSRWWFTLEICVRDWDLLRSSAWGLGNDAVCLLSIHSRVQTTQQHTPIVPPPRPYTGTEVGRSESLRLYPDPRYVLGPIYGTLFSCCFDVYLKLPAFARGWYRLVFT